MICPSSSSVAGRTAAISRSTRIVEDDVGRHRCVLASAARQCAQRLEHRVRLARRPTATRPRRGSAIALALRRRLVLAEHHALFAAQDRNGPAPRPGTRPPCPAVSTSSAPRAISWRITPRQNAAGRSAPTPKVGSRSCRCRSTASVASPRSTRRYAPRRIAARCGNTADSTFCASTVPSNVTGGAAQLSQCPQSARQLLAEAGQQRARAAAERLGQRRPSPRAARASPASAASGAADWASQVAGAGDVLAAVEQQRARPGRRRVRPGRSAGSSASGLSGMSRCTTNRTSGRSIPMPKAIVATIMTGSPERNRASAVALRPRLQPGMERDGRIALLGKRAATRSVLARLPQ